MPDIDFSSNYFVKHSVGDRWCQTLSIVSSSKITDKCAAGYGSLLLNIYAYFTAFLVFLYSSFIAM
jgi:hypothetical protein